jgi:hypothetical protein
MRPTPIWALRLDHLPAQAALRITIRTIPDWMEEYFPPHAPEPDEVEGLRNYIAGNYFFEYRGEQVRRPILVPLQYERTSRQIQSLPPQSGDAPYILNVIQRLG